MAGQTVVVSVLADTKKFSRAFKDLGKQTGLTSLGNKVKSFGSKLASMAKTGVKALAGIGVAIAALAIKGGFARMMNIEDAQAKLRGLGHDAKSVDAIMNDALASVKGTAFGLDEAATTAATAVAAGIKPGQELEGYLRLVADAATIAGIDMGEMGSIMNKVNANGKAMTENLNQLQDRGIPVLGWLADEYGVTTEEMSKMVTQGKVDAETFNRVLEENIGGAALESGNTTRGAFKNMMAALSRAGESVLTDVFPMFKDAFGGITVWLDGLTDRLKPLGEAFSKWLAETAVPAVKRLAAEFRENVVPVLKQFGAWVMDTVVPAVRDMATWIGDNVIPALKNMVKWIVDNREMLTVLAVAITAGIAAYKAFMFINTVITAVKAATVAFRALNLAMIANPIGLIVAAIAALVAGLVWFFTQTELGQEIWANFTKFLTEAWENVTKFLSEAWDNIVNFFTSGGDAVDSFWTDLWNGIGDFFTDTWEGIKSFLAGVLEWVVDLFMNWTVYGLIIKNWDDIAKFFTDIWDNIVNAVQSAIDWVADIIDKTVTIIKLAWELYWKTISKVFSNIWDGIVSFVTNYINTVKTVISNVINVIKTIWTNIWNAIKNTVTTVFNAVKTTISNIINGIRTTISNVLNTIKSLWSNAWTGLRTTVTNIFNGIKNAVSNAISNVVNTIRNLPNTIKNIFSNAGSWLLNAGKNIIQGFINGIIGGFNRVRDTLSNLTNLLPDWKGPPSKDKKILQGAGNMIIQGLSNGLRQEFGLVKNDLVSLTKDIASTDLGTLSTPRVHMDVDGALAAGGRGNTYNITVQAGVGDPVKIGREVAGYIREYERMGGVR